MAGNNGTFIVTLLVATTIAANIPLSQSQAVSTADHSFTYPTLQLGLSFDYYQSTCSQLESIVRNYLDNAIRTDPGLAAGLLRLHFHDCFVQGCDASVLLDGSASGPGEKQAPPNLSLRQAAFTAINEIRALIDKERGRVVSCADVLALAARDSVVLSDGPTYKVPLGRRDGLNFATQQATLDNLPRPSSTVSEMLPVLTKLDLNLEDLVALSGAHTIGIGHCSSFADRLYPSQASNMNDWFANQLRQTCPEGNSWNTQPIDHRSPSTFDNKYYIDLRNREGLFTSDQDLYTDSRTQGYVNNFANSPDLFFRKFVYSMVKMGQLGMLTGESGEIRANCSARNPSSIEIQQIVVGSEGDI